MSHQCYHLLNECNYCTPKTIRRIERIAASAPDRRSDAHVGRIAANEFAGIIRPYGYSGHRRTRPRPTDTPHSTAAPGRRTRPRPTIRCTRRIGRIAANAFAGIIRPYFRLHFLLPTSLPTSDFTLPPSDFTSSFRLHASSFRLHFLLPTSLPPSDFTLPTS